MTNDTTQHGIAALGTWAWGDSGRTGDGWFGSELDEAALDDIADKAHDAGFTMWDTAVVYGMGRSETVLGQVLRRFRRDDYQLSTKFTPQAAGTGPAPVADMLEQSLTRLRTDHIDLYWIHNPADVARWTPQLIPLLESGTVKRVGVSNHNLEQLRLADSILRDAGYRVEAAQNHFSLLHRASERAGILDYCRTHDIRFFAYMVLEQGALSGRYSPQHPMPQGSTRAEMYNSMLPQMQDLTDALARIGESHGARAADVATAWAIEKGAIPIVGVTKPHHIDGLARATRIVLSTAETTELESLAAAMNAETRGGWEQQM
ncbi:aldo/keto reductase [Pseudolysinimonas sp.]|uniref:aldo/keto reductase n=1 Tax=Pseudolysinimonas sp. TaxID=2680009 RepID=UPI003F7F3BEC